MVSDLTVVLKLRKVCNEKLGDISNLVNCITYQCKTHNLCDYIIDHQYTVIIIYDLA